MFSKSDQICAESNLRLLCHGVLGPVLIPFIKSSNSQIVKLSNVWLFFTKRLVDKVVKNVRLDDLKKRNVDRALYGNLPTQRGTEELELNICNTRYWVSSSLVNLIKIYRYLRSFISFLTGKSNKKYIAIYNHFFHSSRVNSKKYMVI